DFPVETSPLTRDHRTDRGVTEKWDLYVRGFELATAYSELVDPVVQRPRFEGQARLAAAGDDEAMVLDEDCLAPMEQGMPVSAWVSTACSWRSPDSGSGRPSCSRWSSRSRATDGPAHGSERHDLVPDLQVLKEVRGRVVPHVDAAVRRLVQAPLVEGDPVPGEVGGVRHR